MGNKMKGRREELGADRRVIIVLIVIRARWQRGK